MGPSGWTASGMNDCLQRRLGMTRRSASGCIVATFSLLAELAFAQFKPAGAPDYPQGKQQPANEQPGQTPTFSANVNLVRLLVSVRNASGGLITNLERADFRVL